MKLPDDFLRIPKTPLFSPDCLDTLREMPLPTVDGKNIQEVPLQNNNINSNNKESPQKSNHSPSKISRQWQQQQQSASAKVQALWAGLNFPTFQSRKKQNSPSILQRTLKLTTKNQDSQPPQKEAQSLPVEATEDTLLQRTHQPTKTQDTQPPQKEAQSLPLETKEGEMLQQTHQPTNTQDSQPPQKEAQPLPLEATEEELLACQLSSWFPTFRHLPPLICTRNGAM